MLDLLIEEETETQETGNEDLMHTICEYCYPPETTDVGDKVIALCGTDVTGEPMYEPGFYPNDCLVCEDLAFRNICETCDSTWL